MAAMREANGCNDFSDEGKGGRDRRAAETHTPRLSASGLWTVALRTDEVEPLSFNQKCRRFRPHIACAFFSSSFCQRIAPPH